MKICYRMCAVLILVVVCGALPHVAGADTNRVLQVVASLDTADAPGLSANGNISKQGRYLCIAQVSNVRIVDVLDPAQPRALASYTTSGYSEDGVLRGSLAYVTDGYSGLRILDYSNPSNLVQVGRYDSSGWTTGVALDGDMACIADGWTGIKVVNVANPTSPSLVGSISTPGWAVGLARASNMVYVAQSGHDGFTFWGIAIVDVGNPASPVLRGQISLGAWTWSVAVTGGLAYAACDAGLKIVSVTNPAAPVLVGSYSTPAGAQGITVADGLAYVTWSNALEVIDVSDPAHPAFMSRHLTSALAYSTVVDGEYIYMANATNGLRILRYASLPPFDVMTWPAIEIGWQSVSGVNYQVQYSTNLLTNVWINVGGPVVGTGDTNTVLDSLRSFPQKSYRVTAF